MECSSKVIDTIVGQIVPSDFKETFDCDDVVVKQVKKRVTKEVFKLIQENKSHIEIILHLKQQLQAIFHGEKLLCDAALKEPAEGKIRISYSESEDESDDNEQTQLEIEKSSSTASKVQDSNLNDITQYKLTPDALENVKGVEMRGKNFPISNDGYCPRCNNKNNYFVILDFLFPSGDMPELLEYLLKHGKAVLWSSKQQTAKCKDPPTFLCNGRCPADCLKNGFNINWNEVDLEKVYLAPTNKRSKTFSKYLHADVISKKSYDQSSFTKQEFNANNDSLIVEDSGHESEEYDEAKVDIGYYKGQVSWVVLDDCVDDAELLPNDEECIIRTMLAFEDARTDFVNGNMKTLSHAEDFDESDSIDSDDESALSTQQVTTPSSAATVSSTTLTDISITSPSVESNVSYMTNVFFTTTGTSVATAVVDQHTSPAEQHTTPSHIVNQVESKSKIEFTTDDFPISLDGLCPYCRSVDVVYIIMYEKNENIDDDLPALLQKLLKDKKAKKIKKVVIFTSLYLKTGASAFVTPATNLRAHISNGAYDIPSFQCNCCTYGFNLDWTCTNLEKIFYSDNTASQSSFHSVASTSTMGVMSQAYVNYQNSSYGHFPQTSVPYSGFPYPAATWLAFPPGIATRVPLVAGYTPRYAGLPATNILPGNLPSIQAGLTAPTLQAAFTANVRPFVPAIQPALPSIAMQPIHPLNPLQAVPLTSMTSHISAGLQSMQSVNSLQTTDQTSQPNISGNDRVETSQPNISGNDRVETSQPNISGNDRVEISQPNIFGSHLVETKVQECTTNESDAVQENTANKEDVEHERMTNEIDTIQERMTEEIDVRHKHNQSDVGNEHIPNASDVGNEHIPNESDVGNERIPNESGVGNERIPNESGVGNETMRNKLIESVENISTDPSIKSNEPAVKIANVVMETADANSTKPPVKECEVALSNLNSTEIEVNDSLKNENFSDTITSPLLNVVVGNHDELPVDMELSIASIDQNVVDEKDLELPVTSVLNLYPAMPVQKDEVDSSPFTESLVNIVTDAARIDDDDKPIDLLPDVKQPAHGKHDVITEHPEESCSEKKLKLEEQTLLGGSFETVTSEKPRNKSTSKPRGKRGRGRGRGRKK